MEKSRQYRKHLMPNGVKTCEFVLLRGTSLYFIEAKTSCPKQVSGGMPEDKAVKYNEYIRDMVDKVRHSVSLYASVLLYIRESEGVPAGLMKKDLSKKNIKVLLVIKDAEETWLEPLQLKLNRELAKERRIWGFSLFVINAQMARRKALVI